MLPSLVFQGTTLDFSLISPVASSQSPWSISFLSPTLSQPRYLSVEVSCAQFLSLFSRFHLVFGFKYHLFAHDSQVYFHWNSELVSVYSITLLGYEIDTSKLTSPKIQHLPSKTCSTLRLLTSVDGKSPKIQHLPSKTCSNLRLLTSVNGKYSLLRLKKKKKDLYWLSYLMCNLLETPADYLQNILTLTSSHPPTPPQTTLSRIPLYIDWNILTTFYLVSLFQPLLI